MILFIVEGGTDKNSLGLILSKLINSAEIQFHIIGFDITSSRYTEPNTAKVKINEQLKIFFEQSKFRESDIIQIVHLTDTDGACIPDDNIFEDKNIINWHYKDDNILSSNKTATIRRNKKKSAVFDVLISTKQIKKIPYVIFFFSCNLEHVLHDIRNADDDVKDDLAYDFIDKFYNDPTKFIDFINDKDFAVNGDYKSTWNFIQKDCNSLKRFSNFHLFFKNNYS